MPSSTNPPQKRVAVQLNAELVALVEQLAPDPTAAMEEAIRQWCQLQQSQPAQQHQSLQRSPYRDAQPPVQRFPARPAPLPSSHKDDDETGWLV